MRRIAWLAKIANYTSGTRWYRRFWNIEVTFQLEFPCKTQRRNGPRVVRIRNEANSYFHQECCLDYAEYRGTVRPEREKRRRRGLKKKEPWRIPKELSPRNFHIGNSYFNGGWIFHRETGKREEEFRTRTRQSNFVRLVNSSKQPDKPTKLVRVFISRIFENFYTMRWNNWK